MDSYVSTIIMTALTVLSFIATNRVSRSVEALSIEVYRLEDRIDDPQY